MVDEPLPESRRAGPLGPVLAALMAKDPADRPTADEAARMLAEVQAGHTMGLASVVPSATPVRTPTQSVPVVDRSEGPDGTVASSPEGSGTPVGSEAPTDPRPAGTAATAVSVAVPFAPDVRAGGPGTPGGAHTAAGAVGLGLQPEPGRASHAGGHGEGELPGAVGGRGAQAAAVVATGARAAAQRPVVTVQ